MLYNRDCISAKAWAQSCTQLNEKREHLAPKNFQPDYQSITENHKKIDYQIFGNLVFFLLSPS